METKTGQCFRSLLSNQYDAVGDRLETVSLTEDFNFLRSFTSFTVTSFTCSFVAVFTCTWLTSTKSLTSDLVLGSNSVIWSQSHFYLSIKPAPTKYTCVIFFSHTSHTTLPQGILFGSNIYNKKSYQKSAKLNI